MGRLAVIGVICGIGLVGCGGSSETSGVTITPTSEVVAQSDSKESNAPPITRTLVREWPSRWCQVKVGASREAVVVAMGSYPTQQDSHKIPLIPYVHLNARGEDLNEAPPMAAGSDTWQAPGSYQFNAFYDTSLHVQQLDFGGPASKLPCATTRVH